MRIAFGRHQGKELGSFGNFSGWMMDKQRRLWTLSSNLEVRVEIAESNKAATSPEVRFLDQEIAQQHKSLKRPHVSSEDSSAATGSRDSYIANYDAVAALLRQYGKAKSLSDGRRVHDHIRTYGYDCDTFVGNCLVEMYGNCGSLEEARAVFDNIRDPNLYSWNIMIKAYGQNGRVDDARAMFDKTPNPDLYSWNILIRAYIQIGSLDVANELFRRMPHRNIVTWTTIMTASAQSGHGKEALDLFRRMQVEGFKPDKITYVCALNACASLASLGEGQGIHAAILDSGSEQDILVGNTLINMYGKCGNPCDAMHVFGRLHHKDVVTWNATIVVLAQTGRSREALDLFHLMWVEGISPNNTSFLCTLEACGNLAALIEGQEIHAVIVGTGYKQDVVVENAIVNLYGKCGSLQDAENVFGRMPHHNVVSWTTLIASFAHNGKYEEALDLFHQMQLEGVKPDKISLLCAVDAIAGLSDVQEGHAIHAALVYYGHEQDIIIVNALISMYGKCGNLLSARRVFDRMINRDSQTWNAMLAVVVPNGSGREALDLFHQLQLDGIKPGKIAFVCALDACASMLALQEGRDIHNAAIYNGCDSNATVGTALINIYGKCGSLCEAENVFNRMLYKDSTSWNAMMSAFTQNGYGREVLSLFCQMQLDCIDTDKITFVCVLDACASLQALKEGLDIHQGIVSSGYEQDVVVGNTLVTMYGKCRSLCDARNIFGRMPHRDIISWNAMATVFAQSGHGNEALDLFGQMQLEGIKPDNVTFVCTLDACAGLPAFEEGEEIHIASVKSGCEVDVMVGNALINMYGKCGRVCEAEGVFSRMQHRNVVSWTAMIAALAQNGHGTEALDLFKQMRLQGIKPNKITFICILVACSHTGRVDDGRQYFIAMHKEYGVPHSVDHYMCMTDLLGRAGHLDEAEDLIKNMPFENDVLPWLCLLNACKIHADVERGIRAANRCFELDPENVRQYLSLLNVCLAADRCNKVTITSETLKKSGLKQQAADSYIELKNWMHECIARDMSLSEYAYSELQQLAMVDTGMIHT